VQKEGPISRQIASDLGSSPAQPPCEYRRVGSAADSQERGQPCWRAPGSWSCPSAGQPPRWSANGICAVAAGSVIPWYRSPPLNQTSADCVGSRFARSALEAYCVARTVRSLLSGLMRVGWIQRTPTMVWGLALLVVVVVFVDILEAGFSAPASPVVTLPVLAIEPAAGPLAAPTKDRPVVRSALHGFHRRSHTKRDEIREMVAERLRWSPPPILVP
jgi:hypothetical protein